VTGGASAASPLTGRRVLVVGASAGVGRAFAELAIGVGAQVVLAARRAERLDEIVAATGGGLAVAGDVAVEDDRRRIVERAVAELGQIDLLFYAVGLSPLQMLEHTDADTWRSLFETNVIGLQRIGVTRDSLKAGDTIKARCHPLRDGSRGCLLGFLKAPDGSIKDWDGNNLPIPTDF